LLYCSNSFAAAARAVDSGPQLDVDAGKLLF
jgi:hypothetical protein